MSIYRICKVCRDCKEITKNRNFCKRAGIRRRSVKGRRIKRNLKTRENDTAYERKSDESSILDTIRIQKRMKSKKKSSHSYDVGSFDLEWFCYGNPFDFE